MPIAGTLSWTRHAWKRSEANLFYRHAVTLVGSNAYVFGGRALEKKGMFVYSLTKRKWKRFPGPPFRRGHVMVLVDDRLYVLGGTGQRSSESRRIVAYDLLLHTSELVSPGFLQFQFAAIYVESRGCILIVDRTKGQIYAFRVATREVIRVKLKGKFYRITYPSLAQADGKIFVYSKHSTGAGMLRVLTLGERNTATLSDVNIAPLPVFKSGMQLHTINGYILGYGGYRSGRRACDQVFIFHPRREEWAEARSGELSTLKLATPWWPPSGSMRGVGFNGKLILFGGFGNPNIFELDFAPSP